MTEEHQPHFTRLAVALVEPSLTNPRKHFDPAKLTELAESIKASDIHQPILVRPLPGSRVADTAWEPGSLRPRAVKPTHEIVAGERRYRAAKLAGKADVPVVVQHLTDDQVLEIQIIENLQREDVSPLEEAEGYQTLMDRTGITADQVGSKIGKSRSYVYSRLKLLDLGTEGRDALRGGDIDASVALLLARIPDTALQAKALASLLDYHHGNGAPVSARDAAQLIRRTYMLDLAKAPFDIKAEGLTAAGACTTCPKRTGAAPDLFAEVQGADLCTNPPCFDAKKAAHQAATMAKAHERGLTVIEGREAKALMPNSWSDRIDGYLRLDEKADSPTDQPLRKVLAKAMKHADVKETLLAHPYKEGELVAVLPTAQVTELLALAAQLDAKAAPAAQAMAERTEKDRKAEREALAAKRKAEFETAWRWAVLEEVWAEARRATASTPAVLGEVWAESNGDKLARHVAKRMANSLNQDRAKRLNKLLGLEKVAPSETLLAYINAHSDPSELLWVLVAEADVEHRHWLPEHEANTGLLLAAEAFEVNIDAVQKSVKAELREKYAAEDQKALLPLNPAAQASGGRGKGMEKAKGKKPNPAARAAPTTSAEEAMQGIATAMQNIESQPLTADEDTLYAEAVALVREEQKGSISLVQRRLKIGYNRAARLLEKMEQDGVVSPMRTDGGRDVLPEAQTQRATPEGIDASPLDPQASAEPEPTCNPADESTTAPAAEPFCTGNLVLLDGTEPALVAYRRKKGGQWTYMLKTTTQGMKLVTGDRVTAAVEGGAA